MAKRTTIYLTDRAQAVLAGGESLSGTINRIADRYYEILRRSRIDLSEPEINAVRDALNGWLAEPAATIHGGPALEVEDALEDGLAERHGIDGRALVAKLRALTYAQEVALVDSVEQYWRGVAAEDDGPGYLTLTAAGQAHVREQVRALVREGIDATAWFSDAEQAANNAASGEDIVIEVGAQFARDKRPHTINLPRALFE